MADVPPAPLGATAVPVAGLAVAVEGLRRTVTTASGPGQRTGAPGAAVAVRVHNAGASTADLRGVLVDLATGPERRPATPADGPDAQPLPAALAAGASASGTYVFEVPEGAQAVRVVVRLQGGTPAAQFDGRLP